MLNELSEDEREFFTPAAKRNSNTVLQFNRISSPSLSVSVSKSEIGKSSFSLLKDQAHAFSDSSIKIGVWDLSKAIFITHLI